MGPRVSENGKQEVVAMTELAPILDVRTVLGEGPIWDNGRQLLHWVDILGGTLYTFDPISGEDRASDVGQLVSTVAPWRGDEVMVTVSQGFASFRELYTRLPKSLKPPTVSVAP